MKKDNQKKFSRKYKFNNYANLSPNFFKYSEGYASLDDLLANCSFVIKGRARRVISGEDSTDTTYEFFIGEILHGVGDPNSLVRVKTQFGNVLDVGEEYILMENFVDTVYADDPAYIVFSSQGMVPTGLKSSKKLEQHINKTEIINDSTTETTIRASSKFGVKKAKKNYLIKH